MMKAERNKKEKYPKASDISSLSEWAKIRLAAFRLNLRKADIGYPIIWE